MRITAPKRFGIGLAMSLSLLALSITVGSLTARGQAAFSAGLQVQSVSDFYSPLATYGTWVNTPSYGRCWHPISVSSVWRPYSTGYWEWTDCGWYWVSNEPWAWACYHYGSWAYDPVYGWLWIPGTEWAPAWVVWREDPEYIGWAPCGPGGAALGPSYFTFVDVHHFHDHLRPDHLIVNNTTIINRTRIINNISRETRNFDGTSQRIVVNRGPGLDPIQRATGQKLTPRPVTEIARQTPVPESVRSDRENVREERPGVTQRPPEPTSRQGQEQRIYRQPPTPAPTGREEPRIYHEAPRVVPEQAPEPRRIPPQVTPSQPPQREIQPERNVPPASERANERERGAEQVRPAPVPPVREVPSPQNPPPGFERRQDRDGEKG